MTLNPKESGKLIANLAKHVKINQAGIEKLGNELIKELKTNRLSPENFSQHEKHPKPSDPWAVDWLFVVDTLNFCFWKPEKEIGWTVNGYTGYFALCAALTRAQDDGIDMTDSNYYGSITKEDLAFVLRSDTNVPVPLLQERLECLHEVGRILSHKYNGSFKNVVDQCNNSALKLLDMIIENFPCFNDAATYQGHEVTFYKRAQILIGDLWACFNNKSFGHFKDISELSMFADYRVPQSLIYFNVMEYSEEMNRVLKDNNLLEYGSDLEIEIRGCSIHAVELVKEWIDKNCDKDLGANSVLIDHFLWDFRRKHADEILNMEIPFHKTLSIFY